MKAPKNIRLIMALGMLLISASIIIAQFFPSVPNFPKGFLEGTGIGIMIMGLIKWSKMKKALKQQDAGE